MGCLVWNSATDLVQEVLVLFYGWGLFSKIGAVYQILRLVLGSKPKKETDSQ